MGNADSKRVELLDACYQGNIPEVQKLIEQEKVNVTEAVDLRGRRPLVGAVMSGIGDLIEYLLHVGADPNLGQDAEGTPLFFACSENMADVALNLITTTNAEVNMGTRDGRTPLYGAAEKGLSEIVHFLLLQGKADPSIASWDGTAPLHAATKAGALQVLQVLVDYVDVCQVTDLGQSALHIACLHGKLECAQLLAEKGCGVDSTDDYGFTPLAYACQEGHLELVKWLLEVKGADPLVWGWNGNAPLHLAAANGHEAVVEYLLGLEDCDVGVGVFNLFLKSPTMLYKATNQGDEGPFAEVFQRPNLQTQLTTEVQKTQEDLEKEGNLYQWEHEVQNMNGQITRSNVKLIHVSKLFESSSFQSFQECEKLSWHTPADRLRPSDKVLYIVHRWKNVENPDPENRLYEIVLNYIRKESPASYVWIDYSCMPQRPTTGNDQKFILHLVNVPTAMFVSSSILILPQTKELLAEKKEQEKDDVYASVTQYSDLLGRAWVLFELFAAILAEKEIVCAFRSDSHYHYSKIFPNSGCSVLGFGQAAEEGRANAQKHNKRFLEKVNKHEIFEAWNVVDPARAMALLIEIARKKDRDHRAALFKAYNLQLSNQDIESDNDMKELFRLMGETSIANDKFLAFNLLLQIATFTVGKWEITLDQLEQAEADKHKAASVLQSSIRGYLSRADMKKKHKAAVGLQKLHRGHLARKNARAEQHHHAAKGLQRLFRGSQDRKVATQLRSQRQQQEKGATGMQRLFRGKKGRANFEKQKTEKNEAAMHIQRITRGKLGRKASTRIRQEKAAQIYQQNASDLLTGDIMSSGDFQTASPAPNVATSDDPFGAHDITHLLQQGSGGATEDENQHRPSPRNYHGGSPKDASGRTLPGEPTGESERTNMVGTEPAHKKKDADKDEKANDHQKRDDTGVQSGYADTACMGCCKSM